MRMIPTPRAASDADEVVDRAPGPDVDAARRLVEDQDPRLLEQALAEQHLLLVAARHRLDERVGRRGLHGEVGEQRADVVALVAPSTASRTGRSAATDAEEGQGRVRRDRLVQQQPLLLAALGQHRDAGLEGLVRRRRRPARAPSIVIVPASTGSAPKIARASSERPLPTSPASPTISPAATVERHVVQHARPAQARRPAAAALPVAAACAAGSPPMRRARASRSRASPRSRPTPGPCG